MGQQHRGCPNRVRFRSATQRSGRPPKNSPIRTASPRSPRTDDQGQNPVGDGRHQRQRRRDSSRQNGGRSAPQNKRGGYSRSPHGFDVGQRLRQRERPHPPRPHVDAVRQERP